MQWCLPSGRRASRQMVSDRQLSRLFREFDRKGIMTVSAAKAGMDAKTARKYIKNRPKSPEELRWTPMFGHLRGKLSYSGLPIWISISSCTEGQVLAPQLFYFGRRNGRVSMQRNVVKWNTDPGMKTSKSAARAIDLHAAFSLVPSLFPLS